MSTASGRLTARTAEGLVYEHGKHKAHCKDCGRTGICEHGKHKAH